jgi:hypothetical protein
MTNIDHFCRRSIYVHTSLKYKKCMFCVNILTVVKELRSKMLGQHPGYFKAVFLFLSKINHSSILFSFFLATFNSFVNARYSDISVDCSDFDAGFLITYRKI